MADNATWAKRVADWRASGLSAKRFCEGRDFTEGGLRNWAHVLKQRVAQQLSSARPEVRLVRVVREGSSSPPVPTTPAICATLVIELGGARIMVPPGFDAGSLAVVLDVVGMRSRGER